MRPRNIDDRRWNLAVNVVAASIAVGERRRGRLLRRAGLRVHPEARVQHGCWFFGANVTIGATTWVNHRCYFDARDEIVVGDRCDLGMEVMLCTSTHEPGDRTRRAGRYRSAPVRIEDGCWLGSRAIVLPGVTIGEGCVVAAGAVVVEDCEPHGLYAGVPARRVRDLP
ncbi:MAG TPA: acyltransferase [Capillimicrobium sp.]|nr:acyltransferase [Capillimicrobium sp.]